MAQSDTTSPRRTANGGRSGPSERRGKRHDRHDEIVQIAGALFAKRGFLATTIRDIADEANILSGSLYHHFESKESIADQLLRAYWDDLLEEYDAVVAAKLPATESLRRLIGASIQMFERHGYAVRMILNDWAYLSTVLPYMDESLTRTRKTWTTLVRQGTKNGEFRADVDPNIVYRTIMGSITSAGRWYEAGGKLTTDELAQQTADIFLRGVAAEGD